MLNTEHFTVVAGNPQHWDDETRARVSKGESLTTVQEDQHKRGRRSAEIKKTVYGWSLRHGSGLDDFGLIYSDFKLEEIIDFARYWVSEDPANREVYIRKDLLKIEG